MAVLAHVDSFVPEQVIAVPKISSLPRCSRTVLDKPQTAEQLVEAPTVVAVPKHTVDIPVGAGGLEGFLPGQSFPTVEQTVDIRVPLLVWFWRSSRITQDRAQQRLQCRTLVTLKIFTQFRAP